TPGIDDHVVEPRPQQRHDPLELLDPYPCLCVRDGRCGEDRYTRAVDGQVAGGDLGIVERRFVGGKPRDVEARDQVEVGCDLPELEVEVHEQDLLSWKS